MDLMGIHGILSMAALRIASEGAQGSPTGAGGGAMGSAPAGQGDFRVHVFIAYGVVLALLFLFSLWTAAQARAASRKLDHLLERLERSEAKKDPLESKG